MSHLLDVNVLVAWGWSDHVDHQRTVRWIAKQRKTRGVKLCTSSIPEIGFVRVSVHRASGRINVREAAEVLRGMLNSLGSIHRFVPDDVNGLEWPGWCASAGRTTDAHLLTLAQRHALLLATVDEGVPGACLMPD